MPSSVSFLIAGDDDGYADAADDAGPAATGEGLRPVPPRVDGSAG